MNVLVASQNEIKRLGVADALARFGAEGATVSGTDTSIESGVSEQPLDMETSMKGALTRLEGIRKLGGFNLYVAIESGCFEVGSKWFESTCVCIGDQEGPVFSSFGPGYPIPDDFVPVLKAGHDLNEAMRQHTGVENAGKGLGFNGWLTDGQMDRQHATAEAVLAALHAQSKALETVQEKY